MDNKEFLLVGKPTLLNEFLLVNGVRQRLRNRRGMIFINDKNQTRNYLLEMNRLEQANAEMKRKKGLFGCCK